MTGARPRRRAAPRRCPKRNLSYGQQGRLRPPSPTGRPTLSPTRWHEQSIRVFGILSSQHLSRLRAMMQSRLANGLTVLANTTVLDAREATVDVAHNTGKSRLT